MDALPSARRSTVTTAIAVYAIPGQGDVKKLSGRDGFRLRTGYDRVIFWDDGATILAIPIGRRTTTTD